MKKILFAAIVSLALASKAQWDANPFGAAPSPHQPPQDFTGVYPEAPSLGGVQLVGLQTNSVGNRFSFVRMPFAADYYRPVDVLSNYIVLWGDSLTHGNPAADTNTVLPYSTFLQPISGMIVTNFGQSGWLSGAIATNMVAHTEFYGSPTIIWAGYNDHSDGQTDNNWTNACATNIAWMVRHLTTSNYLVLGIMRGTNEGIGTSVYTNIVNFNGILSSVYGPHFFDAQRWLQSHPNWSDAQDFVDLTNDVTPHSLRFYQTNYPWVHVNTLGNVILAQGLANTMLNNWNARFLTSGQTKQAIGAWAHDYPALRSPLVRRGLNLQDDYAGDIFQLNVTNLAYNFTRPGYGTILSIDTTPMSANQVYLNTPLGIQGALGYLWGPGANRWQVFGVSCDLGGKTTLTNVVANSVTTSTVFENDSSQNGAGGPFFYYPNISPGAVANMWGGGTALGVDNSVFWAYTYVGSGSLMNSWGPNWWGTAQTEFHYANGNSFSTGNATNSNFTATNSIALHTNIYGGTPSAGYGYFWASNYDLYWSTPFMTNRIVQGK